MIKTKRIPKFKTIAEEANFWNTHDIADFIAEMKETKVTFDPADPKEEVLTIRLQAVLKKRLEKAARSYGVSLSTLSRIWLIDKIRETENCPRPLKPIT